MKYSAFIVGNANAPFEKVEKELDEKNIPPGHLALEVKACGVCHSDCFTVFGAFPGIEFPRSPGHEVAGVVAAVGPGVHKFKPGDRAGIGWYGGHCGECRPCAEGDFVVCRKMQVTGIHFDGGYGEYVLAPAESFAPIPDELSFVEAAPLMCAGVTVYNGLRRADALPGDVVAVQGIGGLGHLAIQVANKMGFKVVVLSRGADKKDLALKLGGHVYLDTTVDDFMAETAKLGGVKVLLATTTSNKAIASVIGTLTTNGSLVILGASQEKLEVETLFLIEGRRKIIGFPSGTSADSADCLKFAALTGIRSTNEVFPASKAKEGYERMMSGKATFRVVLDYEQK